MSRASRPLAGLAAVLPAVLSAGLLAAQDSPPARDAAAELLRGAYEQVYSAEARGLTLFKAGDIEMRVQHEGGEVEWEDGLLWKAGFAPVIEHEAPGRIPLRPASEELLMSMLGWGMGFAPWDSRFAGARFALVGRAGEGDATVNVSYPDGSRSDEVFSIASGRIVTVTNGTFRTSFEYARAGDELRVSKVTRIAVAAGAPTTPDEVAIEFTDFDDADGIVVATEATFVVKKGETTVRFDSELSKTWGNASVPVDDVAASYAGWAERALRRALDSIDIPETAGLTSLRIGELAIKVTMGDRDRDQKATATWTPDQLELRGDALPERLSSAITRSLRLAVGLDGWPRRLDAATFELQAAPDPQRRMQIAIEARDLPNGAVATIEEGRLTALAVGDRTTTLRYEQSQDVLRLVGFADYRGSDVEWRTAFSAFRSVDGFVLPSRLRISLPVHGGARFEADIELRELATEK